MKGVSVVGLGKLGACLAATIASKGYSVVGIDQNEAFIDLINKGQAPVPEPGLSELIASCHKNLRATSSYEDAIAATETTFIIVPTPSDDAGGFSVKFVRSAAESIGRVLAKVNRYHLVCLTSTVLPGASNAEIIPLIEKTSGKTCGKDFGYCYNPEFIALGDVIRGLLKPDMVLIGEYDKASGDKLQEWYKTFCENSPAVARMNLVNAELTKLCVNTYVTTKITFANMLSDICMRLPGADVDVVSGALGMDSRIGRKYLTGALGYGGPCFPRDNKALAYMATRLGADSGLAQATDQTNRGLVPRFGKKMKELLPKNAKIAVLGLAYKPDTNVVEESQGMILAKFFADDKYEVTVHDPLALDNAKKILGGAVKYSNSLKEGLADADAVIVTIPCAEYKKLAPADLSAKKTVVLIDCWRTLKNNFSNDKRVRYVPLGVGETHEPHTR